MKQIISMLLSLVMVMSAVCVSAEVPKPQPIGGSAYAVPDAAAEGYNATPVFEEDFETGSTTKFTNNSYMNMCVSNASGHYLEFYTNSSATNANVTTVAGSEVASADYIKFEAKIKLSQADNGVEVASYNGSGRSMIIQFSSSDTNVGTVGEYSAVYNVGIWNTLEMYFDNQKKTVTVYVNGELAELDKQITYLPKNIRFTLIGKTINPNTVVSLDDVKFYVASNKINPTVSSGETTTDYTAIFWDKFSYSVNTEESLNDAAAVDEKGVKWKDRYALIDTFTGFKRHKQVDPEDETNYVYWHDSSTNGVASLKIKSAVYLQSLDPNIGEYSNLYFEYKFYPTQNMKRYLYAYDSGNGGIQLARFDESEANKIYLRNSASVESAPSLTYKLNEWNTIKFVLTKKDNGTDYTVYLNDEQPVTKSITSKDLLYFGISDQEMKSAPLYIDDIEIGTWSTSAAPTVTTYPDTVLKQGKDSAIIFTSYTESNNEISVTPIIAAYKLVDGKKVLAAVKTLSSVTLTADVAAPISEHIGSGDADAYKVFFMNSADVLTPLSLAKDIN